MPSVFALFDQISALAVPAVPVVAVPRHQLRVAEVQSMGATLSVVSIGAVVC